MKGSETGKRNLHYCNTSIKTVERASLYSTDHCVRGTCPVTACCNAVVMEIHNQPITCQQLNAFRCVRLVMVTCSNLKTSIRMGRNGDLRDSVGAGRTGVNISQAADFPAERENN